MYQSIEDKVNHLMDLLDGKSRQADVLLTAILEVSLDESMTIEQIRSVLYAAIALAFPRDNAA